MKKKLVSLAMALAMTLSLAVPALAAENEIGGIIDGGAIAPDPDATPAPMTGDVIWNADVVSGEIISVVMPISVEFYIKLQAGVYTVETGSEASQTSKGLDQVLSGEAKIINNSSAAITLTLVGIQDRGIQSYSANPTAALPSAVLDVVDLSLQPVDSNTPVGSTDFAKNQLSATPTPNIELATIPKPSSRNDNVYSMWMHGRVIDGEDNTTWNAVDKCIEASESICATLVTTLKVDLAGRVTPDP